MIVSDQRARVIYELWRKGVSVKDLSVVTGFEESTIRGLINSDRFAIYEIRDRLREVDYEQLGAATL